MVRISGDRPAATYRSRQRIRDLASAFADSQTAHPWASQRTLKGTKKALAEVKRTRGSGRPAHNNCSPWRNREERGLVGRSCRKSCTARSLLERAALHKPRDRDSRSSPVSRWPRGTPAKRPCNGVSRCPCLETVLKVLPVRGDCGWSLGQHRRQTVYAVFRGSQQVWECSTEVVPQSRKWDTRPQSQEVRHPTSAVRVDTAGSATWVFSQLATD